MSHVFIATDDLSVADSLRRERPQWSLSIATDRVTTRALLASRGAEVMLLDRRAPWVDELLLIEARELSPDTVCVALVLELAVSDAVRNSRLAHQVVSASAPPSAIAGVCDRAMSVRKILGDPEVLSVVSAAPELAAPPELWRALSLVLEDPDSTAADVASVVASDAAIATHVLRLTNSAFFGLGRKVTQLRDAVSLLGFTTIRALVLESLADRMLPSDLPELKRKAVQDHSMATARVARSIAGAAHTSDAFLSGLLMDVGVLVLASVRPAETREALSLAKEQGVPLYIAEQQVHGFGHAAVGAGLLGLWGMPYTVIDAVAHHHDRPNLMGALSVREALYLARDATQERGPADPYDVRGALIVAPSDDLSVSLLIDSARSIAADLTPGDY
jgi:HD-like signal output (HDOD) protein